jgi:hypothetical protein
VTLLHTLLNRVTRSYWVVSVERGSFYQRCYDPDCRAVGFQSAVRFVPDELLPPEDPPVDELSTGDNGDNDNDSDDDDDGDALLALAAEQIEVEDDDGDALLALAAEQIEVENDDGDALLALAAEQIEVEMSQRTNPSNGATEGSVDCVGDSADGIANNDRCNDDDDDDGDGWSQWLASGGERAIQEATFSANDV